MSTKPTSKGRKLPADFENPFDYEPVRGRSFTKKEVKERMKILAGLFNLPYHGSHSNH